MTKQTIEIEVPDGLEVDKDKNFYQVGVDSADGSWQAIQVPLKPSLRIPPDGDPVWVENKTGVRISSGKANENRLWCYEKGEMSGQVRTYSDWETIKPEVACEETVHGSDVHVGKHSEDSFLALTDATAKKLRICTKDRSVQIGFIVLEDN